MKNASKKLKIVLIAILGIGIYTLLIVFLLPDRFYRHGNFLPGLNGWEFGTILVIIYLFLTFWFLESPLTDRERDLLKEKQVAQFKFKDLVILNVFLWASMFSLLFATQMLENLIGVLRGGGELNEDRIGFVMIYNMFASLGVDHDTALYWVWTFSAIPILACFIFFGVAVDYAKDKSVFELKGLSPFSFIFWVNILLGSTGWMYIAWFTLTNFDFNMWSAIAQGETWGYFSLGVFGVFFNSPAELTYMLATSCGLFFANFVVLKIYLKQLENKNEINE